MALNYAEAIYALDDSDLDVYQSRVWLRVLRRGVCFESQRSMAKTMNISLAQINKTIKWLLKNGWIVRTVDEKTGKAGYSSVIPGEQIQQLDVIPGEQAQPETVIPGELVIPGGRFVIPHERHLKAKESKQNKTAVVARDANEQIDSAIVFYENHIDGITPHSSQLILDAVDTYSEPMVIDAMREAVANNVRKWKYIEAILKNWKQNGRAKSPPEPNGRHANGSADDAAVWDTALDHARRGDPDFSDPALKAAVRAFGWPKLQRNIPPGKENFYKSEFLRIYHEQPTTAT